MDCSSMQNGPCYSCMLKDKAARSEMINWKDPDHLAEKLLFILNYHGERNHILTSIHTFILQEVVFFQIVHAAVWSAA